MSYGGKQIGRHGSAADAVPPGVPLSLFDRRFDPRPRKRKRRRRGLNHEHRLRSAERPVGAKHRDDFAGVAAVTSRRMPVSAVKILAARSFDIRSLDTKRLESLPCRRQIENGLGAGADDEHRRPRQLQQIGRFIKRRIRCTPDPAGREDTDSVWRTSVRQHEGRRDGRRTIGTLRDRRGTSRADTLRTPSRLRNLSSSSESSPIVGTPLTTAVIAGTAPLDERRQHSLRRVAIVRDRKPLCQDGASSATTARGVESLLDLRKNPLNEQDRHRRIACAVSILRPLSRRVRERASRHASPAWP